MIVLSIGIDLLKHFGYSKAVDYTWEHGKSCIVLSFFFAVNTVIGEFQRFLWFLIKFYKLYSLLMG